MSRHDIDRGSNSAPDDDSADRPDGVRGGADGRPENDDGTGERDEETLEIAARAELLAAENRRLRSEYARARQSRYRRTAHGLIALGLVSAIGGVLFPDGQQVLFAFAGTGFFGGLLTYYLTPGQFVAAETGERVYAASASNGTALAEELGLGAERIYVPTTDAALVRLFVPRRAEYELPNDRTGPIVTDGDERGLLLEPTGLGLYREFERTLATDLAATPSTLAAQLATALVEQFELAGRAEQDIARGSGADTSRGGDGDDPGHEDDDAREGNGTDERAIVAVSDSAFGPVDRFDHPIASFLAVGFAIGLERPVELEVLPGDDRADWLVVCRWERD